jgi:uncharacterized damage-inducible protein DinB
MPGLVRPVADEREGLLAFLDQARDSLRVSAYGLTEAQAKSAGSASELSIASLVKHLTATEHAWLDTIEQHRQVNDSEDYQANFRVSDDETMKDLLDRYDDAARRTRSVVAGIDDLDLPVPVPRDAPWFPADVDAWSVRWVLLHLITETAKHAGHADIVRESVDGATFYPLMAAAEGWPTAQWLQPWQPAS